MNIMHEFVIFVTIKVICLCVIELIAKLLNKYLDIYDLILVKKKVQPILKRGH